MKKGLIAFLILFLCFSLVGEEPFKLTLDAPIVYGPRTQASGYFSSLLEKDMESSFLCSQPDAFKFDLVTDAKTIVAGIECKEVRENDKSEVVKNSESLRGEDLCHCLKDHLPKLTAFDLKMMEEAAFNDEMQFFHANSLGVQTAFAREALFEFEAYAAATDEERAKNQQNGLKSYNSDKSFAQNKLCQDQIILNEGAEKSLGDCNKLQPGYFSKLTQNYRMGQIRANGPNHSIGEVSRRSELGPESEAVKRQLANREKLVSILAKISPRGLRGDGGIGSSLDAATKKELEILIPQLKSISFRYLTQKLVKDDQGNVEPRIQVDVGSFVDDYKTFKKAWRDNPSNASMSNEDFVRGALAQIEEVNIYRAAGHCSYIAQSMAMICSEADKTNQGIFTSYYTPVVKTKFEKGSILLDPCLKLREAINTLIETKKSKKDWSEVEETNLVTMKSVLLVCDAANDRSRHVGMSDKALENLADAVGGDKEKASKMAMSLACYNMDDKKYSNLMSTEAGKVIAGIPSDIHVAKKDDIAKDIVQSDSTPTTDTEGNTQVGIAESKSIKNEDTKKAVVVASQKNFSKAKEYYKDTMSAPSSSTGSDGSTYDYGFSEIFSDQYITAEKAEVLGADSDFVDWGGQTYNAKTGDPILRAIPVDDDVILASPEEIASAKAKEDAANKAAEDRVEPLNKEEQDLVQSQPETVYANNAAAFNQAAPKEVTQAIQEDIKGIAQEKAKIFELTRKSSPKSDTEKKQVASELSAAEKSLKEREERLAQQISKLVAENEALRAELRTKGFVDGQDQKIANERVSARNRSGFSGSGLNFGNNSNSGESFNRGSSSSRQVASLSGASSLASDSGGVSSRSSSGSRESDFYEAVGEGKVSLTKIINYDFTDPDQAKVQASKEQLQNIGLTEADQKLIDNFTSSEEKANAYVYEVDTVEGKKSVLILVPESKSSMGYYQTYLNMPQVIYLNRAKYSDLTEALAPALRAPAQGLGEQP